MTKARDVFLTPGEPCPLGCEPEALPKWISFAERLGTGKRVVAAANWQWWDVDYTDPLTDIYEDLSLGSVLLCVGNVLSDSSGKWKPGSSILTTALKTLHRDCIFETRNSLYVMTGTGTRKKVEPQFVLSILWL